LFPLTPFFGLPFFSSPLSWKLIIPRSLLFLCFPPPSPGFTRGSSSFSLLQVFFLIFFLHARLDTVVGSLPLFGPKVVFLSVPFGSLYKFFFFTRNYFVVITSCPPPPWRKGPPPRWGFLAPVFSGNCHQAASGHLTPQHWLFFFLYWTYLLRCEPPFSFGPSS